MKKFTISYSNFMFGMYFRQYGYTILEQRTYKYTEKITFNDVKDKSELGDEENITAIWHIRPRQKVLAIVKGQKFVQYSPKEILISLN